MILTLNKMADKPLMTSEEKIAKAASYKEEGNVHFKKEEFKNAIRKYHYALLHLRGIGEKNPITGEREVLSNEMQKQFNDVKFGCFNNLAACLIKEERWERVIDYCNKALEIHPNNVKALFRKGQACYNVKDWDKASDALQTARKLEPNDTNIIKYQTALEQQLKKQREKEKAIYAGMFDK